YKVLDPRARILKRFSEKAGKESGNTKWFEMSDAIEKAMLERDKPLYPNVDFYSASTYYMMELPPEVFTPIFAVSRVTGWAAHVIEQQSNNKLIRPKAHYIGELDKPFKPISER
ncbi:MAG: citrate synthase, partial [Planctomycetes bacterium]|nr:citrate synthase [Planctomycetota bacterium]